MHRRLDQGQVLPPYHAHYKPVKSAAGKKPEQISAQGGILQNGFTSPNDRLDKFESEQQCSQCKKHYSKRS